MQCEVHEDSLRVYCETCRDLICHCALSLHQNHKYKLVTECYPDHHQEIEANLTTVKNKVADINTAVTNLITREREVTTQGEEVKKKIHTQAQLIINLVQQSEKELVQQVDTTVQQKTQLLTKQKEEAETMLNQLKGCEDFVEQSLKVGSQQQVLREKQNMVQIMTIVNQDVNPVVFQPIEEANITFTRNQTLVDRYKGIGKLKSKSKSVLVKDTHYFGEKSTTHVNLQTQDGSPFIAPLSLISYELFSTGDSQPIACDITKNQSGNYIISFTPNTREEHELIVRLGGVNIPGTPFTLHTIHSPEIRAALVERKEQYMKAMQKARCLGDTETQKKYGLVAFEFNRALKGIDSNQPLDLRDTPPPPPGFTSKYNIDISQYNTQPRAPPTMTIASPQLSVSSQSGAGGGDTQEEEEGGVDSSIPLPKTPLQGLQQRLEKYQDCLKNAQEKGESIRARRSTHIIKQHETAIKMTKAGKPYDFSGPPGYPPIPTVGLSSHTYLLYMFSVYCMEEGRIDPSIPIPKTPLEALEQRRDKYLEVLRNARKNGETIRGKRSSRIIKRYMEAIKLTKKGELYDFSELPIPPGYPPIPIG